MLRLNTGVMNTTWESVSQHLQARREARAARKQLERELAGYTSPSDLADLYAVLDRGTDLETAQVREVLNRVRSRAA